MDLFQRIIEALYKQFVLGTYRLGGLTGNIPSPRVPIPLEDISYDKATETLTIKNLLGVTINTVQNTNSMEPSLDIGHITINSDSQKYMATIKIGSVITFDAGNGMRIIHQIIDEAEYEGETYYITQQ